MLERNAKKNLPLIYVLIGIPFFLYIFIVIVPLCVSIFYSLLKWDGIGSQSFIGIKNYATMIKDKNFWLSTTNTLIISLYCVIGQVGVALLISFLMTNRKLKLKEFHRTVIFFPVVLAPVVIGFVWKFVYDQNFGLLNTLLRAMGLDSWIRLWLDDTSIILTTVSIPVMWQYIGLYLVILMSAISAVPTEVYECAEIDGANWYQRSVKITLPMIWDTLKVAIILCASGTMKIYDHIYIMTNGGPGRSSSVLALYCFKTTFENSNFGYGATISVMLLVFSLLISWLIQLLMGSVGRKNA